MEREENLWQARQQSLQWLEDVSVPQYRLTKEGFILIDECIDAFNRLSNAEGESQGGIFARVTVFTLAKARNLLLGCLSLTLDALAQESGALVRPLIETIELMAYFRLDPKNVEQAAESKLPSAGRIAMAVDGQFKDLRGDLNETASHFSLQFESVRHLFSPDWKGVRPSIGQRHATLSRNLEIFLAFQVFTLREAILSLDHCNFQDVDSLIAKYECWHRNVTNGSRND
jgi:hypothetical protein